MQGAKGLQLSGSVHILVVVGCCSVLILRVIVVARACETESLRVSERAGERAAERASDRETERQREIDRQRDRETKRE